MYSRSLQAKFAFPVSALIVVTTLLLVTVISVGKRNGIEQSAQNEMQEKLSNMGRVLGVTDAIMMERVKGSMKLLMERGGSIGASRQGDLVDVGGKMVPDLVFGGQAQANRFELVDGVTSSQGGTATLFSKAGDEFVRISTNVKKDDKRATGTLLDPNGLAIKAIREGRAFYGQVDILGNPFLTGYDWYLVRGLQNRHANRAGIHRQEPDPCRRLYRLAGRQGQGSFPIGKRQT